MMLMILFFSVENVLYNNICIFVYN